MKERKKVTSKQDRKKERKKGWMDGQIYKKLDEESQKQNARKETKANLPCKIKKVHRTGRITKFNLQTDHQMTLISKQWLFKKSMFHYKMKEFP